MKPFLLIFFCLIGLAAVAQKLSIGEFIAMNKFGFKKIDSIMAFKGFSKTKDDSETGFHIAVYLFLEKKDTVVNRYDLIFGERYAEKITDIEYAVWRKDEAENIVKWLLVNGYKKQKPKLPDLGGGPSDSEFTEYAKASQFIFFTKEPRDNGLGKMQTAYSFKISYVK